VLLPYKGQIIYDGMCRTYNIYFGGGIRGNLKEEYMVAKQNGRIRTTLEPEFEKPSKKPVLAPDSKKVVADIVHSSSQLRGGTVVQETAFEVLRASAKVVEEAVLQKEDLEKVRKTCQKVFNALKRLDKVLERAER
jgi:DNA polymerase elongation subunit (family B)